MTKEMTYPRTCTGCNTEKPREKFVHTREDGTEWRRSRCDECQAAYMKEYWKRKPEKVKGYVPKSERNREAVPNPAPAQR